jgi:hypothetical protein
VTRALNVINKEETVVGRDGFTVGNLLSQCLSKWQMHIEELINHILPRFGCLLLENHNVVTRVATYSTRQRIALKREDAALI